MGCTEDREYGPPLAARIWTWEKPVTAGGLTLRRMITHALCERRAGGPDGNWHWQRHEVCGGADGTVDLSAEWADSWQGEVLFAREGGCLYRMAPGKEARPIADLNANTFRPIRAPPYEACRCPPAPPLANAGIRWRGGRMIRPARAGDEAAIDAFLARYAETSMFLRANLAQYGLFDEQTPPHATRFWLAGTGRVEAVFGLSNTGFVMTQAPDADHQLWDAFANRIVGGRKLAGITGETTQVSAVKKALDVVDVAYGMDEPQPLFRLALDQLAPPFSGPGLIRPPPVEVDRGLLMRWMRGYAEELHMTSPPTRLDQEALDRTERALSGGDVRLLELDGQPVAMTAINARLPDMVQIGGVYTPPPELRGRGLARQVVARHMDEERARGVKSAILFASGPAACRAYEAIGFRRIGSYALSILKDPIVMGGQA